MPEKKPKGPIPTGWMERGAKLAGQTGRSAARFVGTRFKTFASPERAGEFLEGFHNQTARQLVDMLGEMKGAAMKLGQLASFYEFAAPGEYLTTYRDALTMLQNQAPPMDPAASRAVIEEEFGKPVDDLFDTFDDEAVAAASIGQVHRAVLPTGDEVAVKVQYPGVDEAVRSDLKNVSAMTKLAVAIAPNLDPKEVANEVKERVLEELDYRREAANQQEFAELFREHPFVVVPKVYPDYCRHRVITQEFIHGEPFMSSLEWSQDRKDELAEILFRFFYGSLHRFHIFSADPHPGNYLLLDDSRVAFLDFGLVRSIDPGTLKLLIEIVLSLMANDKARGREALEGIGILSRKTPEIDAVWDHLVMINKPVLEDRPFKIDPPMVQEVAAAGFDPRSSAFQTLRKVGVPGIMVTFNRMSFGVASLLARLESTANWHAIARELWEGSAPRTQLGKLEREWVDKVHPDWIPPLKS
ncbi:MAG: AarF/ABC1/UbiB kinase family protein [Actinomycetota bacterium]|nr:AarF/ABC1/UbiB kinase family protein [Actinomycetota bacterium]